MTPEILIPGQTSLAQLERLFRSEAPAVLDPSARKGVDWAAAQIAKAAAGSAAVYGVNTGFGKLASLKIAPAMRLRTSKTVVTCGLCARP